MSSVILIGHQCKYCGEFKDSSDFNKEHVISESLGVFGTMTQKLKNKVCKDCNHYFSTTIELATKDSPLLPHRRNNGLLTDEIKTLRHNRQNTRIVIKDEQGIYQDVYLNKENNLHSLTRIDGITVFNSTKGRCLTFNPISIEKCHRSILESLGLCPKQDFIKAGFFFKHNPSSLEVISKVNNFNLLMKDLQLNYRVDLTRNFFIDSERKYHEVRVVSNLSKDYFRLVAKIAYNHFLFQSNDNIKIDNFSCVRRAVLKGERVFELVKGVDGKILQHFIKDKSNQYHLVLLLKINSNLFGVISFFNDCVFVVKLSPNFDGQNNAINTAYIFDTVSKNILKQELNERSIHEMVNFVCFLYDDINECNRIILPK